MKAVLKTALAGRAALIHVDEAAAVAVVIDAVRAVPAQHDMILVIIPTTVPKLDRALMLAAIGPLATEVTTGQRIAALDLADGVDSTDVIAAALFLAEARSTTGQILRITPRG